MKKVSKICRHLLNAPKEDDKVSVSYLWFHIGNIAATAVFFRVGWGIATSPTPNLEGLSLLMLTYLGLITGNKLANKVIAFRAMNATTTTITESKTVTKGAKHECE